MKYFNNTWLHIFLIVFAVFILYWQSTRFDFVLDDKIVVTENTFVKEGIKGIGDIFSNDAMTGYFNKQPDKLQGGRYRPLSMVIFAICFQLFKLNPFYYHLINILFYTSCCILLYFTMLRVFNLTPENLSKYKIYIFSAALLFTIHPVHIEAVANVKGLDEIMTFLFGISAFLFTLLYFDSKRTFYLIASLACYLLSLLSKESTLPLVLAIPVSLYFFRKASIQTVLKHFLILLIPAGLYLIFRYHALGFLAGNNVTSNALMNNPYLYASASQKAGTILYTFLLYLKLLFFPHPLTHDYYPYQIKLIGIFHPYSLLGILVIVFLMWVAIKGIKGRSYFSYVIFYFLVTIVLVLNIVINVGTFMNERFLFVPSFAFALLLSVIPMRFNENKKLKISFLCLLALMLVGFSYKAAGRIPDWKDKKTLNLAAIKVSKNSARANCFYGVTLYDEILTEKDTAVKLKKIKEAEHYIDRSLQIYPEYSDALTMKAGLAAEQYKIEKNTHLLLQAFREVLKVKHVPFIDEFTDWLAPRVNKDTMANFYFDAGYKIFASLQHDYKSAEHYLQNGYKIEPTNAGILFGSCITCFKTGDYSKSIEFGNAFTQRFGENAYILFYLGNAQIKNGQVNAGKQNIEKAYSLNAALKNSSPN